MVESGGSPEKTSSDLTGVSTFNARGIDVDAEDDEHDVLVGLADDELELDGFASDEGHGEASDESLDDDPDDPTRGVRLRELLSISSLNSSVNSPSTHGQLPTSSNGRQLPNPYDDEQLSLNRIQDAMANCYDAMDQFRLLERDRYFDSSPEQSSQTPISSLSTVHSGRGLSTVHGGSSRSRNTDHTFPSFETTDSFPLESHNNRDGQTATSFHGFGLEPDSSTEDSLDYFSFNGLKSNGSSRRLIPHQRNRSNVVISSSVSSSPVSSTARRPQNPRQFSDLGLSRSEYFCDQQHPPTLNPGYHSGELAGNFDDHHLDDLTPRGSATSPLQLSGKPTQVLSIDRRRGQSFSDVTGVTDRFLQSILTELNAGALTPSPRRLVSGYSHSRNHPNSSSLGFPAPFLTVSNPRSGRSSFVYTITLIPARFSLAKVIELVDIFEKALYIPTLVTMNPGEPPLEHYGQFDLRGLVDTSVENSSHPVDFPRGEDGKGWPIGKVPTEIFERIAEELSWEDLLNMRRVNHEFEMKVSGFIFKAVVVPFRRQIYSAKAHEEAVHSRDLKGKGKATLDPVDDEYSHMVKHGYYSNVKDKDVYNGMEVFNAWGPHIRKFAMSFEVNEDVLRHPPNKGRFETHNSFWGPFIWPSPHYARYAACENLEKKADEHQLMTTALSKLDGVYELALSVVSGLGWITGPDQSDRQKIFSKKPEVFGSRFPPSIVESRSRYQKWRAITAHLDIFDAQSRSRSEVSDINSIPTRKYPPLIFDGVDHEFAVPDNYDIGSSHTMTFSNLIPNSLTAAQQEWLLENNWAQEAFLTSWCMALVDNACTFKHVHTLKFARLSSRYLKMLERQDIWTALENLRNVTILLVPDWRDVVKTDDRIVDTPPLLPSLAADHFFVFLDQWLVGAEKLTALNVGYAAGGERARGMCARNKHVLPAPVLKFSQPHRAIDRVEKVLTLPHIQHLTLSNCWIPPDMLKRFVLAHNVDTAALHTLVLDSVSLTALPGARYSDPAVPPRPVGTPFAAALSRLATANPTLRNLSPVVQLQMIQDLQLSSSGQNDDLGSDVPYDWLEYKERKGSWPDVINAITPGETLDQKRFLYGHREDEPPPQSSGPLRRIEFISCGYIRLTKLRILDQQTIGRVESTYINCLRQRSMDLAHVMMSTEDHFLGQIVPTIDLDEYLLLNSAFGMTSGWGDDGSKYENREDGQPEGGSGRFNGSLVGVEQDGRQN